MKRVLSVVIILLIPIFFSSCTQSRNISSLKIITACFAQKNADNIKYSFYVSNPIGSKDEGKEKSTGQLCTVLSTDFESAIRRFEDIYGKYEMTHLSAFFADAGYISENYFKDASAIWKHIKVSPLVKFFVMTQSGELTAECIGKYYDYSPEKYISSWRGNRKKLLCTMSEIMYSVQNPIYTASVPVISISDENGLLECEAFAFYNVNKDIIFAFDKDFQTFGSYIEKYGKTPESIILSLEDNQLLVAHTQKGRMEREMMEMCQNNILSGYDLMNIVYYSKKLFLDYRSYYRFIENSGHLTVRFSCQAYA